MRLLLSSFGIGSRILQTQEDPGPFEHLAPLLLSNDRETPDLSPLLLMDTLFIDRATHDRYLANSSPAERFMKTTLRALVQEGLVSVVDFNEVLNRSAGRLREMVQDDLRTLDDWVPPLKESLRLWESWGNSHLATLLSIARKARSGFWHRGDDAALRIMMLTSHANIPTQERFILQLQAALDSPRRRRQLGPRMALRRILSGYLANVNANLILSAAFDAPLHDWLDYEPMYRHKFTCGRRGPERGFAQRDALHELFDISFPELRIRDEATLLRVLTDNRIVKLRALIEDAVQGRVSFDSEFARRTIQEVIAISHRSDRVRRLVSYLTSPVSLVPLAGEWLQLAAEDAVMDRISARLQGQHEWYYLLCEATTPERH